MTHEAIDHAAVSSDLRAVAGGFNQFGRDLYGALRDSTPGNLAFAPGSVAFALAVALAGASGKTAAELELVLKSSLPDDRFHEACRRLLARSGDAGVELTIANRLWGQRGHAVKPAFLERVERCHQGGFHELDFAGGPAGACRKINSWIDRRTNGRIPELLDEVDPQTRLIITNAVWFLGRWEHQFESHNTKPAPFSTTAGHTVDVPMMHQMGRFYYGETDQAQILEMPYRFSLVEPESEWSEPGQQHPVVESRFVMDLILPRSVDLLDRVERRLLCETAPDWHALDLEVVDVSLPRFRIETEHSLALALIGLGLRTAFSRQADFTSITSDPDGLMLSRVVQKVFVDVDETGTEAAAATAIMMLAGCANADRPIPRVFRADRPFLFMIRDRGARLVHFVGRVADPTAG